MRLRSQNDSSSESGSELGPGTPSFEDDPPSYLKYKTFEDLDSLESEDQQIPDVAAQPQEQPANPIAMTTRAYQREMVEESLKRNIIVTMDTGSGKTQVAILRIQAELARSSKLIWFLAPTVALVDQQLERIQEQIPSIVCKRLCGADNVDTWSNQGVWDAFLQNVGLVISTPEVLFRACQHRFVKISSLSLLVIDEAHNCKGKSPGGRLMLEVYRPAKEKGLEVPHILGLTASPVNSSNMFDLEKLEWTLDSICRSPTRHREELLTYVNLPEMSIVSYEADDGTDYTPTISRLDSVRRGMDISQDPGIAMLRANRTERGRAALRNAIMKQDTKSRQIVSSFCHSTEVIRKLLGPWAADCYIHTIISSFLRKKKTGNGDVWQGQDPERRYLADLFEQVQSQPPPVQPTLLSIKAQRLVEMLASYAGDLRGIVFVTERTTVAMLAKLLKRHPLLSGWLKVGTMVGLSSHSSKNTDILEPSHGDVDDTLRKFRTGEINLLIATSVLEEGIDVPACNLVVCFEKPVTLKVFIQRRGRARMRISRLIMMLDTDSTDVAQEWMMLERQMKAKYEDDQRQLQVINAVEDEEHADYPVLEVESEDGHLARLTIDDAKQHLDHFCATLSSAKFVDFTPFYISHMVGEIQDPKSPDARFRATVQLPVSIAPELRQAESTHVWKSERNAFKDAAFQAYNALFQAGLLNDHLLPLKEWDIVKGIKGRPRTSFTIVHEQLDPWPSVAQAWNNHSEIYKGTLRFSRADNQQETNLVLQLPVPIPQLPDLTFYWDSTTAWKMKFTLPQGPRAVNRVIGPPLSNDVETMVSMAFGHRGDKKYAAGDRHHMVCLLSADYGINPESIGSVDLDFSMLPIPEAYLVRDATNQNHPYFFSELLPSRPPDEQVRKRYKGRPGRVVEYPADAPWVAVRDWPKKAGYLQRPDAHQPPYFNAIKLYHRVLPAEVLKVDRNPAIYARFGSLYPALLHVLEVYLVAKDLLDNRLETLELHDLNMVVTAICSAGARMHVNYERIEFMGDCILKLSAASNCLAHHPTWPEGYLSRMKDGLVSNSKLAQVAVDFGLDRYIISKSFANQGWLPLYIEDHLKPSPSITATRNMSTKTLADVVEALVGVSYKAGGLAKALQCLTLFMPEADWKGIDQARTALIAATPEVTALPSTVKPLETLLGYTFTNKALLIESLTHASYNVPDAHASLERLEFFGDCLVEYLVVRRLFDVTDPEPLPHWKMHLIRNALVNSDIMSFLIMENSVTVDTNDIVREGDNSIHAERKSYEKPLWSFMRHSSSEMAHHQRATAERFEGMRGPIRDAMENGKRYPWALLARLQAQKFFSDLFESVLGAIYVDSGSFEVCDAFLERVGLFAFMRRILQNEVDCLHPKEELGKLAGTESVEYVVEVKETGGDEGEEGSGYKSDGSDEAGKRSFCCMILVGEHVAVEITDGVSREEAKTRAAEKAIQLYELNGGKWWW